MYQWFSKFTGFRENFNANLHTMETTLTIHHRLKKRIQNLVKLAKEHLFLDLCFYRIAGREANPLPSLVHVTTELALKSRS